MKAHHWEHPWKVSYCEACGCHSTSPRAEKPCNDERPELSRDKREPDVTFEPMSFMERVYQDVVGGRR
jgi:hypothetical protein